MPRQFGPTRRAPCARTSARSFCWRSAPSAPTSANPAEITQSARTPFRSASCRRFEHVAARNADHGEIDGIGDLLDRAIGAYSGDRFSRAVHGVRRAYEVGGDDVAKELAADDAASLRRADHGDAGWGEERTERRRDGDVVALLDPRAELLGRCDREPNLDLAALERARHLEAGVSEDAEHGRVLGQHVGDEALDADVCRARCEPFEQPRRSSAPLQIVRDGECDLRSRRVTQARVLRRRDDALVSLLHR